MTTNIQHIHIQLTICCAVSQPTQTGLCMTISLTNKPHGRHLDTKDGHDITCADITAQWSEDWLSASVICRFTRHGP